MDIQHQELLLAIAEVSATFVGFSGVVGVFRERNGKLEVRYQRHLLFQMITTGLSALALSVTPFLIAAFGFPEPLVWRISSGIYVFFSTLLTIRGIYQDCPFLWAGLDSVRTAKVLALVTTFVVGISILNGLGAFSQRASAIYLVSLFWTLGLSGFFFTRMVTFLQPPSQD
ncbi:MAG: hypothetical protein QNJ63_24845 [Calothrix sp. MO_192.B10]|nr:hypothetical protein [Calothrix sp. MO_192.B10]MDJ0796989.1 hypothetical protein [Calothrix sp. MO_167.B12]